jgi:hypothetical protein
MTATQMLQEFKVLETGSSFLAKNFKILQKDYPEKYLAIDGNKIIADSSSFEEIIEKVKKMNLKLNEVLIEFIPSAGQVILY